MSDDSKPNEGADSADSVRPQEVHGDPRFHEFLRRIRAGDEAAAAALVKEYEPLVRRAVRVRLEDQRLRQVFDSMDVCQSVLASFFIRSAAGSYDLEQPTDLVRLLVRMARNKLAEAARGQYRLKRGGGRLAEHGDEILAAAEATDLTPSSQVAGRELLAQVLERLSPEERRMVELRGDGRSWAEVAQELGGTSQARRVQLARAVRRVSAELGIDDSRAD